MAHGPQSQYDKSTCKKIISEMLKCKFYPSCEWDNDDLVVKVPEIRVEIRRSLVKALLPPILLLLGP